MICECNLGTVSFHSWDFIGTYFLTPWSCPYMKYFMASEFLLAVAKLPLKLDSDSWRSPVTYHYVCRSVWMLMNCWVESVAQCLCVCLHVLELGDSSVTVVTSLKVGWPRNRGSIPSRGEASRPVLWSTLPPVQWVPGTLSLSLKQPRHKVDHALHYDWCHYVWTLFYIIIVILNILSLWQCCLR